MTNVRAHGALPALAAVIAGAIDDVRPAEDAGTAYTADYGWRTPIAKGAAQAVVGLAVAICLYLVLRRARAAGVPR
ncbi:hypothetical protein [Streptomyces sp. NPDC002913]